LSSTPADSARLFVYGTLRQNAGHVYNAVIRDRARDLGQAVFQGRLFDFGEYPGVVDSDDPADLVVGEVYEFYREQAKALQRLDQYEECGPGFAEPTEYRRVLRSVRLQNPERTVTAWLYLYNHPTEHGQRIAHGDYLRYDDT
jgi:gamma-glutamylcyclotransferase (GGCT)/AIG2-like uncharacterized protein YtfP